MSILPKERGGIRGRCGVGDGVNFLGGWVGRGGWGRVEGGRGGGGMDEGVICVGLRLDLRGRGEGEGFGECAEV